VVQVVVEVAKPVHLVQAQVELELQFKVSLEAVLLSLLSPLTILWQVVEVELVSLELLLLLRLAVTAVTVLPLL
jgi:hypothetical protein